ncbi:hypothetical protein [Nocardia rhamnosiphila]|uniref:Protein kinase domain-containing protein n=1 Tax=Nocardia rhamnosiphila TaxID=426716 RepID=A0ABV2WWH2_9NOCA
MSLPTPLDYRNAVQHPRIAFRTQPPLDSGDVLRNAMGLPKLASGGFATTFTVDADATRWAVRCFHRGSGIDRGLQQRYEHIARLVSSHPELRFLTPVTYRPNGVQVRGNAYPTVRMRWVDGEPLGLWLEDWAADGGDPRRIEIVRERIAQAVATLRALNIAHGDLQHGNILVDANLRIHLIDYDGMYLPALRPLGAIEQGHRNYQHPGRGKTFDYTIDDFAAAVIDLSLRALRHRPQLWDRFGGTGENLLFDSNDFVEPLESAVFGELSSMAETAEAGERLRRACQVDYAQVGDVLLGRNVLTVSAPAYHAHRSTVFAAEEVEEIRDHEGEVITVVGTVKSTTILTRWQQNTEVALINLGRWEDGDFTIYAEDQVCAELYARFGGAGSTQKKLPSLVGWRVAITGPLEFYKLRSKLIPQIQLQRVSLLQNLSTDRFDELRAHARQRTEPPDPTPVAAPRPAAAPAVTPSGPTATPTDGAESRRPQRAQPRSADTADVLRRLYSSGFAQPTESTDPSPQRPVPGPAEFRTNEAPRTPGVITPSGGPASARARRPPSVASPENPAHRQPPAGPGGERRTPDPPEQGPGTNRPPPVPRRYRREPFPYRPPPPPPPRSDSRHWYVGIGLVITALLVLVVLL